MASLIVAPTSAACNAGREVRFRTTDSMVPSEFRNSSKLYGPDSIACRTARRFQRQGEEGFRSQNEFLGLFKLSLASGGILEPSRPLQRFMVASAISSPSSTSAAATGASPPPLNVLITGSTKGLGLALARRFLQAGDNVIICSREGERVDVAVKELQGAFGEDKVAGIPCNVADAEQVKALSDFAVDKFGRVDVWINNAGSNAYKYGPLLETSDADIREIVETNTLGVMLCCRQALLLMKGQLSGGHIFNMDGAGADGNPTPRFAAYGATKRSLAQFTKSLQAELKMMNLKNVVVHNLSPGMVTTELLMSGANTPQAKFFINALAEPAEEVADYLVPLVREVPLGGKRSSTYIRYLTKQKAYSQIFGRLLFKLRKDRFVPED